MLKNKNIVIIGGTTGLGLSAAKAYVANGASVVVVGRNVESVEEAKKKLGNNAEAIAGDATNPDTAVNAINICNHYGVDTYTLYAFEPVPSTANTLRQRLAYEARANIHEIALSSRSTRSIIYRVADGAGINSMHSEMLPSNAQAIAIDTVSVEDFCSSRNIEHIDLLKCDTEGHDAEVILGAEAMLQAGKITVLQFEYNHRWIAARHFLKDIFDFAHKLQYSVAKVCSDHLIIYPSWHFELERFFEANYVLIRRDVIGWFPTKVGKLGPHTTFVAT